MRTPRIAIVWRGDPVAWNRLEPVARALAEVGVAAVPVAYDEAIADQVRAQLADVAGVLVWVDPLHDGKRRGALDALLREVAERGPWVSAHPDTIDKMGVKDVLVRTRHLGWGSDVHLYGSLEQCRDELPSRLASSGPRVLKPSRGNRGQAVWKVESAQGDRVTVLEAVRGSAPETLSLADLFARLASAFEVGALVDQAYQPRLADGMIRCYVAGDRVVGFGTQHVSQLLPATPDTPRVMHPVDAAPFRTLRRSMEDAWVPQLTSALALEPRDLPLLWDADFFGAPREDDAYELCEINVSCVTPYPPAAPPAIATLVAARLGTAS